MMHLNSPLTPYVAEHFSVPVSDDFSIRVNVPTKAMLMRTVRHRALAGQGYALATINLDHVVKLREPGQFRAAYQDHDLVVADGRPIVWISKLAGSPVEVAPGSELIEPMCAEAARLSLPVAFLGSRAEVLEEAAKRLTDKYPGLEISAKIAPPFGVDPNGPEVTAALREIRASGAKICFIALGAPKQEIIAIRGRELVPGCGFASIGAGLDFIAGAQVRAPSWMRKFAMEWFWRMIKNPRRLARRYFLCAVFLPGLSWRAWRGKPADYRSSNSSAVAE